MKFISKELFVDFLGYIKFKWSAFIIYSFASLLSVSLRIDGFEISKDFIIKSTIIGTIINSITLALLFTGFKAISHLKRFHKTSLSLPLIMVMAVGAIRGIFLNTFIDWFGFENTISGASSALSSAVYTTIYYGGSCLLIGILLEGNDKFERAFRRAATFRLIAQHEPSSMDAEEIYSTIMKEVKTAITAHIPESPTEEISSQQVLKVSAEIRSQIELVIRPLSHRLWIDSSGRMRTGDPLKIVRDSISQLNYSNTFLVLYHLIIGIFGISLTIGLTEGLVRSLFSILVILIVTGLYKNVLLARYKNSRSLSLLFLFLLFFTPITSSIIVSTLFQMEPYILESLLLAPSIPVVAIASSIYVTVRSDRRIAIAAAMAVATSERKSTHLTSKDLSKRDLSGYLHNSLQSELLRISKQLQLSAGKDQVSSSREHLLELSETLNRTHEQVQNIRARGIDDLHRICNAWSGLAEIKLVINQNVKPDDQHCLWIIECVQELITNSIRHGEAENIEIRLEAHGDSIAIDLSHDGKGRIVNSTGLGQRYMKSHSQVSPEIMRGNGRTSIKLLI